MIEQMYGFRVGFVLTEREKREREIKLAKEEAYAPIAVRIIRAHRFLNGEEEFKFEYDNLNMPDKIINQEYNKLYRAVEINVTKVWR